MSQEWFPYLKIIRLFPYLIRINSLLVQNCSALSSLQHQYKRISLGLFFIFLFLPYVNPDNFNNSQPTKSEIIRPENYIILFASNKKKNYIFLLILRETCF